MTVSNFLNNEKVLRNPEWTEATLAVRGAVEPDPINGALMTPIHLSSTYELEKVGVDRGFDYGRTANPTRSVLQQHLAKLENGHFCFVQVTGMAAATAVAHLFKAGDHILLSEDCYGGVFRLFHNIFEHLGVEVSYVYLKDLDLVNKSLQPNTRCIWAESPTNPLLRLVDISALSEIAHQHGSWLLVDNTFCSPVIQKPLNLGADIVLHSLTKYINGHCDTLGGAIITKDAELAERIDYNTNVLGIGLPAFDSWMILRGVKTLPIRYKSQEKSANKIARFLENHPNVKKVIYPGLESHPDHTLAIQQQKGFGSMIGFEVVGGTASAIQVVESTEIITLAESLGGVGSLIEIPAVQSHASMTPEARKQAGISDSLIRFSVGIEGVEDLIGDLDHALNQIHQTNGIKKEVEHVGI